MNANDLIDALKSGAVLINNLNITINNNTAETVVIGDGTTVNRITAQAQPQRTPLITGVDYQYSHCAPLAEGVAEQYWEDRTKNFDQARSKFAREYAEECVAHWNRKEG